jgi:hypothetical protein
MTSMQPVFTNELRRSKLWVSKYHHAYLSDPHHPRRVFFSGSTVLTTTMSHVEWVGGPSGLAWIPDKGVREWRTSD